MFCRAGLADARPGISATPPWIWEAALGERPAVRRRGEWHAGIRRRELSKHVVRLASGLGADPHDAVSPGVGIERVVSVRGARRPYGTFVERVISDSLS